MSLDNGIDTVADPSRERPLALIPQPLHVQRGRGQLLLPVAGRIVCGSAVDQELGSVLSDQLTDTIRRAAGMVWDHSRGQAWTGAISLDLDQRLGPQEYLLRIADPGERRPIVNIRGGDCQGLRWGVQTLRQIIMQCGPVLPALHIQDRPAYPTRIYSLDVTRGRVPTMDWLRHWADILALYKFNQLQLYIEHTMAFPGMSEAWRGTSPLEPGQITDFDGYCARLGIELVPSISTFGHHYANLRTRGFRDLGEFPEQADRPYSFIERQEHHTINVNHPQALAFSTGLIDAYAPLMRTRNFNIGGDETFDLGKGRSRQNGSSKDPADMYADYLISLCNHLHARGRHPMFWGDVAVSMPRVLDRLPKDCTLLNWLYDPQVGPEKVALVASTGARQVVCSAVHAWNLLLPGIDDAWNNISRLSRYGIQYGAVGAMVTDWGDYGHINDPRMSLPGMAYAAQCFWNPNDDDRVRVDRDLGLLIYGDATGDYLPALIQAGSSEVFGWEDMVRYWELDDGHGGLNQDVAHFLAGALPVLPGFDSSADADEARRGLLMALRSRLGQVDQLDDRLVDAAARMGRAAAGCGADAGRALQAQLMAVHGQRLFNALGRSLAVRHDVLPGAPDARADRDLADALEIWFESYATLWRQVSRESELGRIAHVVWGFADILRRGTNQ
ncbi:glycoside hydrolase family 20 zincin-like fold domain-containing protein [Bifidobacterium sp. B4142]|uniref:glycoside hydrolase family 20 zincin-like fold domain-containing protein n=1 Tax=Bifidobacterium sp. B4142 TaxID=2817962 RepID=UPI00226B643D|nr:glycoside hydrolase family 20 zincin-like fold domain-containing protein [Bifidobacterium sp. B4142]MCX8687539.1 family 20 glycosylhydrolase [Bifidobacterium sp. B4142]